MLFGGIAGAISVVLLAGGFMAWRRLRLITDVPTSKVRGVFIGLNEVKGTAESTEPLAGRLTGQPCVWYFAQISDEYTRTVTSTDSSGHTSTSTEHYWKTREQETVFQPFEIVDETGRLRVLPGGARVNPLTTMVQERRDGTGGGGFFGGGGATGNVKYLETAIPIGAPLYVMGPARLRDDVAAPEIAFDEEVGPFVISTGTEERMTRNYGLLVALAFPVAVLAAGMAGLFLAEPTPAYVPLAFGAGVATALLVLLVGRLWLDFNSLVRVRERQERAGSLIDVQLTRRSSLLPPLVEVVKGAAAHEEETQQIVADLRTEALQPTGELGNRSSTPAAAGATTDAQTAVLRSVFAVAERYPALRADATFTHLQQQLVDTEDRLALARQYYNDSVTAMADRARTFPTNLVARVGGFRVGQLYLADGFERTPVSI